MRKPVFGFDRERLRSLRSGLGWSQEKLAVAAGIERTNLVAIEGGNASAGAKTLAKLARALNVEMIELCKVELLTVADYRRLAGYVNRAEAAAAAGIPRDALAAFEGGERITDDQIEALGRTYNLDPSTLTAAFKPSQGA